MSIKNYFKGTKDELKQINWPTKSQAINFTLIVILVSVVVAYLLGFFDFIFSRGLEKLISF